MVLHKLHTTSCPPSSLLHFLSTSGIWITGLHHRDRHQLWNTMLRTQHSCQSCISLLSTSWYAHVSCELNSRLDGLCFSIPALKELTMEWMGGVEILHNYTWQFWSSPSSAVSSLWKLRVCDLKTSVSSYSGSDLRCKEVIFRLWSQDSRLFYATQGEDVC